jgi:chromosome segregation ATPase
VGEPQKIESTLTETRTAVDTAKAELMELTIEIERVKGELADLAKRRPELAASIKVLEGELRRANMEYDQVAIDTQKARVEHQNFLAYESKSRKILAAKDHELAERQAEIDVGSSRLKAQRSFLTPM